MIIKYMAFRNNSYETFEDVVPEDENRQVRDVYYEELSGDQVLTVMYSNGVNVVLDANPFVRRKSICRASHFISLPNLRAIDFCLDVTGLHTLDPDAEQCHRNSERNQHETRRQLPETQDGWIALDDPLDPRRFVDVSASPDQATEVAQHLFRRTLEDYLGIHLSEERNADAEGEQAVSEPRPEE